MKSRKITAFGLHNMEIKKILVVTFGNTLHKVKSEKMQVTLI